MIPAGVAIGGPNLTIDNPDFDFGFVPQHAKISHVFWLYSTGDSTLKITKIVPGWGCTKAPLEKDELAVGDSTRLEIIFDTGKYKRKITKRPKIVTNEGPPGKRVQIISNVIQRPDSTYPAAIKPYKLDLTQFGEKIRNEVKFRITNVSDKSLVPTIVSSADEYFEVELPNSIGPGESGEAKLKLKEYSLDKEFEKSFTFELDDAASSRFTVPVKRKLRPSLSDAQTQVNADPKKK